MAQPFGFTDSQHPHFVCNLQKALYGLRQAPRAWFQKLHVALVEFGFQPSRTDTSLFVYNSATDILVLLIHIDDVLVTGSNSSLTSQLLTYLHNRFSLRHLGTVSYFLGIQVTQHGDILHLTQQKYIQDLLQKTQMVDTKPASTPGASGRTLSQHDGLPLSDPSEYRTIVGALQYATITRPAIAFVVNKDF